MVHTSGMVGGKIPVQIFKKLLEIRQAQLFVSQVRAVSSDVFEMKCLEKNIIFTPFKILLQFVCMTFTP